MNLSRLFGTFILSTFLLCAASCSTQSSRPENPEAFKNLINLSKGHMVDENWNWALRSLAEAEKMAPRSPEIFYLKSMIYLKMNENALALKEVNASLDLAEENPFLYLAQCRVFNKNQQYQKALESTLKLDRILTFPSPEENWGCQAIALLGLGQKNSALEAIEKAIQKNASACDLYAIKSKVLVSMDDLYQAHQHNVVYMNLCPQDYKSYMWKAYVLDKSKKHRSAAIELKKMLKGFKKAQIQVLGQKALEHIKNYVPMEEAPIE